MRSRRASPRTRRRWASTTTSCASPVATRRAPSGWPGSTCAAAVSPIGGTRPPPACCTRRSASTTPSTTTPADPALEAIWAAFADLAPETLGRQIWEMYDLRGFALPGNAKGASAVHRPTRLHARARRLQHQPRGRVGDVRARGAGRPRPEGLRLARHDGRPVRDRLRPRAGLLPDRRARAEAAGHGHGHPARRRHPAREGRRRALPHAISSPSTSMPSPSATSTTCARCCISHPSRPRRSPPAPWGSPTPRGCRNVSARCSRNARPADESRVPIGATEGILCAGRSRLQFAA